MRLAKLRAIALAEWRGLPETPFIRDTAKPIGDTMAKVLAGLGLKDRLREDEVLRAWSEIVGEFIAGHATPSRLKDRVLYVQVLQPTALYDLDRVWKPQILAKLQERFGVKTVRDIKFRIG